MIAAAIAVAVAIAAGAPLPPAPSRWVEDRVGLLSPAPRAALDQRLERYQEATGHQIVLWIGGTLDGAPLDDWAARTFAAWKVGRKGIDDGLVVFVLAEDRAIDIEVGYGLEGSVPDATASRIIREVMAPRLASGDADRALTDGVEALLTAIEGGPWTGDAPAGVERGPSTVEIVVGALLIVGLLILMVTHPRLALLLLWSIMSGGRAGGHGGGGFSGGGGRSGGGGARGGW